MARGSIAKKEITSNGVKFNFSDGTVLDAVLDGMSEDIKARLAIHGLAQKVGDSYAGDDNVPDAVADATATYEALVAGTWGREREPGEGNLLERAVVEYVQSKGKVDFTIQDAQKKLGALDKEGVKKLRNTPEIAAIVERMRAERAAARASGNAESILGI